MFILSFICLCCLRINLLSFTITPRSCRITNSVPLSTSLRPLSTTTSFNLKAPTPVFCPGRVGEPCLYFRLAYELAVSGGSSRLESRIYKSIIVIVNNKKNSFTSYKITRCLRPLEGSSFHILGECDALARERWMDLG